MKKSIAKIGFFSLTAGEEKVITYGDIQWLESKKSGGREYSAEPNGELTEVWADGQVVYSSEENNGYTIKLTLLALIDKIAKEWLGYTVDEANKTTAEYANGEERPHFGLVIAESTTENSMQISFYYDCQVSKRPSKNGKTSEGKFEAQFSEFEIASRPRDTDRLVCFEVKSASLPSKISEPSLETPNL